MLQSIREKTSGWIAGIILGAVILTMAFFGIESYVGGKVETYAAKIEGPARFAGIGGQEREIDANAFRQRFDQVRAATRDEQGEAFDAAAFESMQSKREVLDQMVDDELLALVAEKEGVTVPPATAVKLPDGRFVVVAVTAVADGDPQKLDAAAREQLQDDIGRARGMVEARAFLRNLRKQYKVTVAEDRL